MKVLINVAIMSAIILMVGCETNKSTLQVMKAKSGDQVLTVLNHIKFDKREAVSEVTAVSDCDKIFAS